MRAEAKEWCRLTDEENIDQLKLHIIYFNERLVLRAYEKEKALGKSLLRMIKILEQDLKQSEQEYRSEYGDKRRTRVFGGVVEDTQGQDASTKTSVDINASAE